MHGYLKMIWFILILVLSGGAMCCEFMDWSNYKIIYYNERETLNLTILDGGFPADIEATSIISSCPNLVTKPLPDQHFDDTFRKYKHEHQIKVPMLQSLSECTYYVMMQARSACLWKVVALFRMKPGAACAQCQVLLEVDWARELRAQYSADQQKFWCDGNNVLCQQRSETESDTDAKNSRTIQITLKYEDISKNESTFVCQSNTFTVKGRLIRNDWNTSRTDVYYNIDEEYHVTCNGSNVHWILNKDLNLTRIDLQELIKNQTTFSKKFKAGDDGMKLICVEFSCDSFEDDGTCYQIVLKEVTFHLNSAVSYYLALASVATFSLLVVVACAWWRRRARPAAARRPRMPTPPPERPPRRQLYYSVPFERPIPGPRRN